MANCLLVYLSYCLDVWLLCPFVWITVTLDVFLSGCYLSGCMAVGMPNCLSVLLSGCVDFMSVFLDFLLPLCLYGCVSDGCIDICASVGLSRGLGV